MFQKLLGDLSTIIIEYPKIMPLTQSDKIIKIINENKKMYIWASNNKFEEHSEELYEQLRSIYKKEHYDKG